MVETTPYNGIKHPRARIYALIQWDRCESVCLLSKIGWLYPFILTNLLTEMKKVQTFEDFAVLAFGAFVMCVGLVAFMAIASVIVKTAKSLDALLF
jgi:hypothetical protein